MLAKKRSERKVIVRHREDFSLDQSGCQLALCLLGLAAIGRTFLLFVFGAFRFYYNMSGLDFFLFTLISISVDSCHITSGKVSVIISFNIPFLPSFLFF